MYTPQENTLDNHTSGSTNQEHHQAQHPSRTGSPASALHRPPISQNNFFPSSPNRRRTSSFGFGSNFFSNITNPLRSNNSSSNIAGSPGKSQQSGNRSRAGSSSRINLLHASSANGSSSNISRANTTSRNNSTTNLVPPASNPISIISDNINTNSLGPDMNVGTPTDDILQGQTRANSLRNGTPSVAQRLDSDGTYSIRLTPFIDHSTATPGLYFSPILRKTKPNSKLMIGRYTDKVRDAAQAPPGSDAPVVFKSKVVSRTHAEFSVDENGAWYVKDLKSSSGTFLNHIRLSSAGVESAPTQLQNGDVLQLGMDFRGGIEDIFRCVKMRVEMNKSWQRKANQFNKEAHERLKSLALATNEADLNECAICLLKIKPCQSVFISPCSHCWHYKCIRPIVLKSYPQFLCPNCRETCDLEADEDESELESSDDDEDLLENLNIKKNNSPTGGDLIIEEAPEEVAL